MNKPERTSRNWPLTLVSLIPLGLFLYFGVGVWFTGDLQFSTIYPRIIVSGLSLFGAFVFARIIWRGHTKKSLSDIISDLLASL